MKFYKQLILSVFLMLGTNVYSDEVKELKLSKPENPVRWLRKPNLTNALPASNNDRVISAWISANEAGEITSVIFAKSTGNDLWDEGIIRRIKRARFYPYKEDNVYYPFKVFQKFEFEASTKAKWKDVPKITLDHSRFGDEERRIELEIQGDFKGNVTSVKVTKSTGLKELDDYIIEEYSKNSSFYPLIVNGKPHLIVESTWFTLK